MKITLYKNCCLNNTYKVLLSKGPKNPSDINSSPFLLYLNSLEKTTIDIDYTYMENSGRLIFDYELLNGVNIYDYNYMKVEFTFSNDTTKIIRYCFISDIRIRNELVYLKYNEDIWHSYNDLITGILPSHLISSRLIKEYPTPLVYGILKQGYDSFNGINMTLLDDVDVNSQFSLIMEFQVYKLITIGGKAENTEKVPLYRYITKNNGQELSLSEVDSFSNAIQKIVGNITEGFIKTINQVNPQIHDDEYVQEKLRYTVGKIYIVPKKFGLRSIALTNVPSNFIDYFLDKDDNDLGYKAYSISAVNLTKCKEYTISNNYKNYAIGTMNTQAEMTYNKLEETSKLEIFAIGNNLEFGLKMQFQGQLMDITNDFLFDYPTEMISSAEYKQAKIAKWISIFNIGLNFGQAILGLNANWANNLNANVHSVASMGNSAMNYSQNSGGGEGGESAGSSAAGEAGLYVALAKTIASVNANNMNYHNDNFKIIHGVANDLMLYGQLNARAFGGAKGNFGRTDAKIINCVLGLRIFSRVPKNELIVKQMVNIYGYSTNYIIDNSNFDNLKINDSSYFQTLNINYNVIQFADAIVYGRFTNKIAQELGIILNSGVRIYYNENMTEDNLLVG